MSVPSDSGRRRSDDDLLADVLAAVAGEVGAEPMELTPPLGTVVDPEALQAILRDTSRSVRVTFEYQGVEVEVDSDGSVTVLDGPSGR